MKSVGQLLKIKGYDVWSIAPDATVFDAIQLMAEKGVGALVVLDKGKLVGITSERDYARKVILKGRSSKTTPVREIMTPHVYYTHPDQSIDKCLGLMNAKRIRHLPVVENDQLIGIVSIGDLVNAIISEQKHLIDQLENYITEYTSIT